MNESNGPLTNGATNGSHSATAAESSPAETAVENGRASTGPGQQPDTLARAVEPASAPPAEKILDENLEEQDIKVAITVTVHGRKIDIMKCAFEKTFYDGLESPNRGILFSSIKQLLEQDVYQAVAAKINRKTPFVMPDKPSNGQKQNGTERRKSEPIPPYTGEIEEPDIKLHEWSPIDDSLKFNRANGG